MLNGVTGKIFRNIIYNCSRTSIETIDNYLGKDGSDMILIHENKKIRKELKRWTGLFAPAGVPDEVKRVLIPAIEKAIKNPELEAKVQKLGFIAQYKSPTELRKLITRDYEEARSIAIKIGLSK